MLNKVTLIGNLGKDPEVRVFDNGDKVANFSLATSSRAKNKSGEYEDKTEWHNVALFKQAAEFADKYLNKGDRVYIEGSLRTRSYDKDGETRYITEILSYDVKSLTSKQEKAETKVEEEVPWA